MENLPFLIACKDDLDKTVPIHFQKTVYACLNIFTFYGWNFQKIPFSLFCILKLFYQLLLSVTAVITCVILNTMWFIKYNYFLCTQHALEHLYFNLNNSLWWIHNQQRKLKMIFYKITYMIHASFHCIILFIKPSILESYYLYPYIVVLTKRK